MFLVRDLVSPRTWLAMTSHLAGFVMGLAVFVVIVTGLSLGFSLLVLALVGPAPARADAAARQLVRRRRAGPDRPDAGGAGSRPGPPGAGPGTAGASCRAGGCSTERATWGEIGYSLLRLPVSAVAVTLSLAAWTAALVLLTLPLYNKYLPSGGARIGDVVFTGTPTMATSAALGLALLLIAPQLTRGFGRLGRRALPRAARPAQRPGRPGDRAGDQPGTGGGRGRGGAAPDRA